MQLPAGKLMRDELGRFKEGNIPWNYKRWYFENLTPELAYLIGNYLTDGSICRNKRPIHGKEYICYQFKSSSIDKELTQYLKKCLEKILQKKIETHWELKPGNRQVQYYISVTNNDLFSWMKRICKGKARIPEIIWKADENIKRYFIAGIMDGDGFISENPTKGRMYYKMGICGQEEEKPWFREIKQFLQSFGLIVGKRKEDKRKNPPVISYEINKESFLRKNCGFHIRRKQNRLLNYAKIYRIELLRDYTPPTYDEYR